MEWWQFLVTKLQTICSPPSPFDKSSLHCEVLTETSHAFHVNVITNVYNVVISLVPWLSCLSSKLSPVFHETLQMLKFLYYSFAFRSRLACALTKAMFGGWLKVVRV